MKDVIFIAEVSCKLWVWTVLVRLEDEDGRCYGVRQESLLLV